MREYVLSESGLLWTFPVLSIFCKQYNFVPLYGLKKAPWYLQKKIPFSSPTLLRLAEASISLRHLLYGSQHHVLLLSYGASVGADNRLKSVAPATSGCMNMVCSTILSTHTKYPLCWLCQDSGMWYTAGRLHKQIIYHGVRKGSNGTECSRSLCEQLLLGGSEWSLCVGNGLAPVSAPLQLNPLLKSSVPEQVPIPTTREYDCLSPEGGSTFFTHFLSPKDLVFLFFLLSSLPLCAVREHSSVATDVHRSAQSGAFQRWNLRRNSHSRFEWPRKSVLWEKRIVHTVNSRPLLLACCDYWWWYAVCVHAHAGTCAWANSHININNSTWIGTAHLRFQKCMWPQIWGSVRISMLLSYREPPRQPAYKGGLLVKGCSVLNSAQLAAGWVVQTLPTPSPALPPKFWSAD